MAATDIIHIRLDPVLKRALEAHVEHSGLTTSQAVRDLLRHALGVVRTPREAAFYEALQTYQARLHTVFLKSLAESIDQVGDEAQLPPR